MMLILLGLIDVFSAVLSGLMFYGIISKIVIMVFGIILLIKGLVFIKSLASMIDLFAGAVLITGIFFSIPPLLFWIAAILLIQKGIFSFF